MKKITKPSSKEEAVYYSDFTGKCFGNLTPPVEVTISFGYGSKNDGAELKLDLSDKDIEPILNLIKQNVSENFKKTLKNKLDLLDNELDDAVQMRDWLNCEYTTNTLFFLRELLNIKN